MHEGRIAHARSLSRLKFAGFRDDAFGVSQRLHTGPLPEFSSFYRMRIYASPKAFCAGIVDRFLPLSEGGRVCVFRDAKYFGPSPFVFGSNFILSRSQPSLSRDAVNEPLETGCWRKKQCKK